MFAIALLDKVLEHCPPLETGRFGELGRGAEN